MEVTFLSWRGMPQAVGRVRAAGPVAGVGKAPPVLNRRGFSRVLRVAGVQVAWWPLAVVMAVVTRRMLVWSRLPRQQARWTGMWWSARLAAIRRMLLAELEPPICFRAAMASSQ